MRKNQRILSKTFKMYLLQIRLGRFQSVKKDGTSCAGKVIQPVIKLLHDDNTEAVLVSSFFMDYFHALMS